MNILLTPLSLLPALDWAAMLLFFGGWVGYAVWAKRRAEVEFSVLATTNRWRRHWMLQATRRENRIVDSAVLQSLSASPQFFASTTILIIGGLLAVLSATERASELVREIPFAARTSVLVFDFKLLMLTGVFVYAFFRFTWSVRQYGFGALLIASAPDAQQFEARGEAAEPLRQAFADRAGRVMALAAETFNDGLRAYYMAFAGVAWLFSPLAYVIATALVLLVLYRREFHSDVLQTLRGTPTLRP